MIKVVLAYSGGLDTSILIKLIKEKYNAEVIAVTVDVGQHEDLGIIKEKALYTGAHKALLIDAKKEFVQNYVLPALQAEGVSAGGVYDAKVRDWHTYNYWEHILQYKSVAKDNLPWSGVAKEDLPKYSKDMCPNSLDLLSKAILIDIDYNLQDDDCNQIATAINKVLSVYLTK